MKDGVGTLCNTASATPHLPHMVTVGSRKMRPDYLKTWHNSLLRIKGQLANPGSRGLWPLNLACVLRWSLSSMQIQLIISW